MFLSTRRKLIKYASVSSMTALVSPPTLSYVGTVLENQLRGQITQYRNQGRLSADETIALVITDMPSKQKLVSINEDTPLQCASLVKPFVIQAYLYCHYLKSKTLYPLSPTVLAEMRGMIVHSNNTFTNYLFKRLGGAAGVQWMLRKQRPDIFRDISIVENIPAGGKTYLNKASAGDYTRFLYATWDNKLPGSDLLKNLMGIPNHDRIVFRTKSIPQNTPVFDKTGSTARLCGNFGIINFRTKSGNYHPYTITCIIEKKNKASNYPTWISARSNVTRELSDTAYRYFYQRYPS